MDMENILIDNLKRNVDDSILENSIEFKDKLIKSFIDRGLTRNLAVELGSLIKITGINNPSDKLINELINISLSMVKKLELRGYSENEIIIIFKNSFICQ